MGLVEFNRECCHRELCGKKTKRFSDYFPNGSPEMGCLARLGVIRGAAGEKFDAAFAPELRLQLVAVHWSIEGSVNDDRICLHPDLVLVQIGRQLCEIEGSIDLLVLYVSLNLAKLVKERLAVLMELLTGTHTPSLLLFQQHPA